METSDEETVNLQGKIIFKMTVNKHLSLNNNNSESKHFIKEKSNYYFISCGHIKHDMYVYYINS